MRYTLMQKFSALRRTLGRVCLTAALSCILAISAQAQGFMNVSEVQPGMTGYAKTVVHGTTIDTFPVEILGVMKNSGPSGDLILAKFSGPLIEETGGIAQGMSGSPVYINGKLLGAVAYGWAFTNSRVGMITCSSSGMCRRKKKSGLSMPANRRSSPLRRPS